jgi:hypothetical protein
MESEGKGKTIHISCFRDELATRTFQPSFIPSKITLGIQVKILCKPKCLLEEVDNENQFSNANAGDEFSLIIDKIGGVNINMTGQLMFHTDRATAQAVSCRLLVAKIGPRGICGR